MKIAFLDVYNPIPINSGGDWYRFHLLNDMGQRHEVTEYFMYEEDGKTGFLPPRIPFGTRHIPSILPWGKFTKILEIYKPEYLVYQALFRDIPAEIVFTTVYSYHFAKIISKNQRVPLVLVMHNIEWQYLKGSKSPLYKPMKIYEHYVMAHVDAIVALSPRDCEYVRSNFPEKKLFYIPPGVDTTKYQSGGSKYDFGNDKCNLLFYGALDREQNVEGLKFIISSLIPALKLSGLMPRIRMNVFGSGKPPKEIDLAGNPDINYLGYVDDVERYIRGADAILVPLKNSGGIKVRILESLACGKPVIASPEAKSGLPDDISMCIHIASSTSEFVNKINQILTNECPVKVDLDFSKGYLSENSTSDIIEYFEEIKRSSHNSPDHDGTCQVNLSDR